MVDLQVSLDRTAGRLTMQLVEALRNQIRSGRLPAEQRLPSTRALAADLDVSRGVAVEAYDQLIAEGFIVTRQGDGTWVAATAAESAWSLPVPMGQRGLAPADAEIRPRWNLRPGTAELSTFPRSRWLAALRAVLAELPADELGYPDHAGVRELRLELAEYLTRVRGAAATADAVVVTAGVAHAMAGLTAWLRDSGHTQIGVEDPGPANVVTFLQAHGFKPIAIPVDDAGLDVSALDRSGVRAAVVTPAHQFPTGVVLAPDRRAALVKWARSTDGLIIEDDYDAEFRYDRDPVGCVQGLAPGHVVLAGSVSKSLAPGLRLGWVVAPEPIVEHLAKWRGSTDFGSPVLEQHSFARWLRDGTYDRHLRAMRRLYRARRDVIVSALADLIPSARVRGVSAGLHIYVELPGVDVHLLAARALASGLAVVPEPMGRGLVLGYSREGERQLREAVEVLANIAGRQ